MCKLSAQAVANYFLSIIDEEAGDSISNLKLQKLCYYAQGFHLALHAKPLFSDKIEAWQHGPVIRSLYHKYKDRGAQGIPRVKKIDLLKYSWKVQNFLNEVYRVYGQFSAWKLRELTHSEPPWQEAFEKDAGIISHKAMKDYFSTLIADNG